MRLGIGLPGYLGSAAEPATVIDWARGADDAGFHAVSAHDKPNHDTWDPLVTLAAVAPATRRVRLATTILVLPARDEALVAKQALTIDQLSGGRMELGVAPGGREDDFAVLGHPFRGRGRRFEQQLVRLAEIFAAADKSGAAGGTLGPQPVQRARPPIRVGGYADAAVRRAVELGDGYMFGVAGAEAMRAKIPSIREAYAAAGRPDLPVGAVAYVAATSDPDRLAQGERNLVHYYGTLRKPFAQMVHTGDQDALRHALDAYREAGVDDLYLFPVLPELDQLDRMAELL